MIHSFIQQMFPEHYYMQGTVLGHEGTALDQSDKYLYLIDLNSPALYSESSTLWPPATVPTIHGHILPAS